MSPLPQQLVRQQFVRQQLSVEGHGFSRAVWGADNSGFSPEGSWKRAALAARKALRAALNP